MPIPDPGRLNLAPRHLAILRGLLDRHVPGAEVWAYGSRTTGSAHEGSDLDLVLRNPADLRAPCPGISALREALRDSVLPMMVEVHDWAGLPDPFRAGILRSHAELRAPRDSTARG